MDPKFDDIIQLEVEIEELETRTAPDGGETVLPMSTPGSGGLSLRPPRPPGRP